MLLKYNICFGMNYKNWWDKGYTWEAYKNLVEALLNEGKTTGTEQSPELLAYAKLNLHRMQRIEKTFKLGIDLSDVLTNLDKSAIHVLVITEGWCGDAAQSVPVIAELERIFPEKFSMRCILRDSDTALIDQFLTNGGRSIPVFIFLDENFDLLGHWGPRPKVIQSLFQEMKAAQLPFEELSEKLHAWYAKDKTSSLQSELVEKIKSF